MITLCSIYLRIYNDFFNEKLNFILYVILKLSPKFVNQSVGFTCCSFRYSKRKRMGIQGDWASVHDRIDKSI